MKVKESMYTTKRVCPAKYLYILMSHIQDELELELIQEIGVKAKYINQHNPKITAVKATQMGSNGLKQGQTGSNGVKRGQTGSNGVKQGQMGSNRVKWDQTAFKRCQPGSNGANRAK